jgi:hypothetical protein
LLYRLKKGVKVKFSKSEGQKALKLMNEWRLRGFSDSITQCQAYELTGGVLGTLNESTHLDGEVRLVDVAIKFVKKTKKGV